MTTTKFEDYLNNLIKKQDENAVVQEYSFLASESMLRRIYRKGQMGSFLRKRDRYAFSEMENRHKRGEL
jgi:hypothetical protein